jgi:hypothetical protein
MRSLNDKFLYSRNPAASQYYEPFLKRFPLVNAISCLYADYASSRLLPSQDYSNVIRLKDQLSPLFGVSSVFQVQRQA